MQLLILQGTTSSRACSSIVLGRMDTSARVHTWISVRRSSRSGPGTHQVYDGAGLGVLQEGAISYHLSCTVTVLQKSPARSRLLAVWAVYTNIVHNQAAVVSWDVYGPDISLAALIPGLSRAKYVLINNYAFSELPTFLALLINPCRGGCSIQALCYL